MQDADNLRLKCVGFNDVIGQDGNTYRVFKFALLTNEDQLYGFENEGTGIPIIIQSIPYVIKPKEEVPKIFIPDNKLIVQ